MKLATVLAGVVVVAHASAQPTEGDRVAVVATDTSADVVHRLDAMLSAPTIPLEIVLDPGTELLDALAAAPARYVVVIGERSASVVDRVDRRVVSRALEAELLVRDPYAAALVVFELLEVVGAVPVTDDLGAPVAPPPPTSAPTATDDGDTHDDAARGDETSSPRRRRVFGSLGGVVTRGVHGDVDPFLFELGAGIERDVSGYVLAIGAVYRGPGRVGVTRTTSANEDVRFDYRRSDLALRVSFGADGTRFGFRLHAAGGPSFVHVRARTRDDVPRRGADARVTGALGLGVEGRVALVSAVWLTLGVGFEWLPGATPYGALDEFLLEEPRFRVHGAIGLVCRFGV